LKISKAEYRGPDSDGDVSMEIEAVVENDTESVIELVKTSVILVNAEGVTVCGSDDDEIDVFIESKETANIDVRTPYFKAFCFEGKFDAIKVILDAQMYRREFHNLGEFDIPNGDETVTFLKKGVDIAGLVKVIGGTCIREKPDDDGDVRLEFSLGIRNISDTYFERVTVKFSIFDQEGAEVDRAEAYTYLAPHSGRVLEPSFYSLKKGRLRNCTGKLTLHVHQPVSYYTDSCLLKPEK